MGRDPTASVGRPIRYDEVMRSLSPGLSFEEARRILVAFEAEGRMKRDTVRPQDRLDAEAIRQRFGLGEDA
jgi:hypothetical protein